MIYMRWSDSGGQLFASVASLVVAFVFLFPIGSRTETVRCPDGTGCVHEEYRSLFTTAFVAANLEGPMDHLNVLTVGLGVLASAGAGVGAYRLGATTSDSTSR